jgi:hypothetical protein
VTRPAPTRERELTSNIYAPFASMHANGILGVDGLRVASIPKETLMRILALAIFVIGTVSIGPAAAQRYDPAYPVCLHVYGRGPTITNAATRRCLSATRRHRAARQSASTIHISRARKRLWRQHIIGIIAASTNPAPAFPAGRGGQYGSLQNLIFESKARGVVRCEPLPSGSLISEDLDKYGVANFL